MINLQIVCATLLIWSWLLFFVSTRRVFSHSQAGAKSHTQPDSTPQSVDEEARNPTREDYSKYREGLGSREDMFAVQLLAMSPPHARRSFGVGGARYSHRSHANTPLASPYSRIKKPNMKESHMDSSKHESHPSGRHVVVIGAGWGGLSVAHSLSKNPEVKVTIVDAGARPGGLVGDGYTTPGGRPAEAGQHGFWDSYGNIYKLIDELRSTGCIVEDPLSGYDEQGQYSPAGLEAVWPVYRSEDKLKLPTGLGQALYTRFLKLPLTDLLTAAPLVAAFSEFDDCEEAWEKYDAISFRELCAKLGVSKRLYKEVFESMILTGLFAPGEQCSAAAALGMAYFFVLQHQTSFDVRWCRGNIGEKIFAPWVQSMESREASFLQKTRATGFIQNDSGNTLTGVVCKDMVSGDEITLKADEVVFAVGAQALNMLVRNSPTLAQHAEFRRFCNLRGTSVLATRLWFDRDISTPYSANACWGFDDGVGMTWFDIKRLHAPMHDHEPGAVIELDWYHANSLLPMSDEALAEKAKSYLVEMVPGFRDAQIIDAAIVRLPNAVNMYYPNSYKDMPDSRSTSLKNVYFVGDLVKTRHGSWSQEKAYVTGVEAANQILNRSKSADIVPLTSDEAHVAAGRAAVKSAKSVLGGGNPWRAPSLVDFLW